MSQSWHIGLLERVVVSARPSLANREPQLAGVEQCAGELGRVNVVVEPPEWRLEPNNVPVANERMKSP